MFSLAGPDGHASAVSAVAIGHNTVVTGSWDKTAKIWHLSLDLEAINDNPLVWIIKEANRPQLEFIKRAYEATSAGQEIIITYLQQFSNIEKSELYKQTDVSLYASFPATVQEYCKLI